MGRIWRGLVRVAAVLLLVALLVGVPVAVLTAVGGRWPALHDWDEAWSTGRVPEHLVMQAAAVVALLLWMWFAVTAAVEVWRVVGERGGAAPRHVAGQRPSGPNGWVRTLVRVAVLSSTALGAAAHAAGPVSASPAPASTHLVTAGESYWHIADDHLSDVLDREPTTAEVAALAAELVDANGPRLGHRDPTLLVVGETVVLPTASVPAGMATVSTAAAGPAGVPLPLAAPAAPAASPESPAPPAVSGRVEPLAPSDPAPSPAAPPITAATPVDGPVPSATTAVTAVPAPTPGAIEPIGRGSTTAGLGAAVLLAAGTIATVEVRRRRLLRIGARPLPSGPASLEQVRTEVLLRALSPAERIARVDLALRHAAGPLVRQRTSVVALELSVAGDVRLYLHGAAVPDDGLWRLDLHGDTWTLPASVPLESLAHEARRHQQPCPALAHIGCVDRGGELFVDLEAVGVLAVESPGADDIVRAMAASMSISPFLDQGRVVQVDVDGADLDPARVEHARGVQAALEVAARTLGSTSLAARGTTTFAMRSDPSGEAWEPVVVFVRRIADVGELDEVQPGGGLGVVVGVDEGVAVPTSHRLRWDGVAHVYEPLGLTVQPIGLDAAEVRRVADLIESVTPEEPAAGPMTSPAVSAGPSAAPFAEPEWDFMVRLLGQLEVVSHDGQVVRFERSKALELVAWCALHPRRSTRSGARAALWDVAVRDATFSNVVSEARRAMAKAVPPPHGEDWLGRTMSDDLPLHPRIVTDADVVSARLAHARGLPAVDAVEVLRPALELVTGMPFTGTSYLWPDAEGHTSSLVVAATSAAEEMARRALELGDIDDVFWATGRGLAVLAGHEELIALRMRAHAQRGDLAGVRHEWESYERSLAVDAWASDEPSPKLVDLRRSLLSPLARAGSA